MRKFYLCLAIVCGAYVLHSCAVSGVMIDEERTSITTAPDETAATSFFITGNFDGHSNSFLEQYVSTIAEKDAEEKQLFFVGNSAKGKDSTTIINKMKTIGTTLNELGVKGYVVPGTYEWNYDEADGLEQIEDYFEETTPQEHTLTPNNGCPLESIEVGDDIQLVVIDSQWYIENWDKNPEMNDKCQIKTRKKLMLEVAGEIKKNANKLILVVLQHPVFTNGFHAGRFSFRDHVFPLQGNIPAPGIATLITEVRSQGGTSTQDRFNERYNDMATELLNILDEPDHRILLISGHEENLQYIEQGNFKQLISGAGSDTKPATISDNGIFSYGGNGFADVSYYKDGSVWANIYATSNGKRAERIFQHQVFPPKPDLKLDTLPTTFPRYQTAAVYSDSLVDKSDFFQSFWGKHYRKVYGTKVKAKVAVLDTLYGGLEVVRPGGGNQTKSLRLVTKDGKEYNMRALKKSAVQFLENTAFKGINGEKYFTNTVPEELILDFYTAAHPYGAFAVPTLAKAAEVYYTTPELFYVPQQKALGKYNEEYGNQLFMIVERPTDDFKNRKSFGYPDDVESTDDLLETLREDEEYILDETAYIRARIFDMLLGDWDRHSDQWRWAEFENEEGKKVFVPIPRDRDQVFANFDGSFLNALKNIMGSANQFGVYGPDIDNVKWFNAAGSKLDRALVKRSDKEVWISQAKFLQQAITKETVDTAFKSLPEEVQDTTIQEIKRHFMARKENLASIVERYYMEYIKFQMLTGTDKDDHFTITRMPGGITQITAHRIKDGEKGSLLFDRIFNSAETEEIWLYGLDDDDVFEVKGTADNPVLIRIIGGQNNDEYSISEGKKIKIYDRRSKENTISEKGGAHVRLTNLYEANLYDYTKKPTSGSTFGLQIHNNPDDGTAIGLGIEKTKTKYIANPFGQRTKLYVEYQSITQGLYATLEQTYAAVFADVNLFFGGTFTSKNYTQNFFGFGNDTNNPEDTKSLDFNRVNMSFYNGIIGLERSTDYGSYFRFAVAIESVSFYRNGNNFFNQNYSPLQDDRRFFAIPTATYTYENFDDEKLPTKGMQFTTQLGGIDSFQEERLTGFAKSRLTFYNSLLSNQRLVLKTQAATHLLVGDQPLFYQSPQLGASSGLRGFREERFTGRHSLVGNADLSYRFQKMKTFLFPLTVTVYGGYDIGRVWLREDTSNTWHQSYGGGLQVRWTNAIKANVSSFYGDEGLRLAFGFSLMY
ncbi:MAG: phosphoesterase [Marinirhabdus sp.]|nr:phosphoesterase [Marinirhabdus sp.]